MTTFEYELLIGRDEPGAAGGVIWYLASNMTGALGDNLPAILNDLGSQGWEVVALGDVGFDARSEIILKRRS